MHNKAQMRNPLLDKIVNLGEQRLAVLRLYLFLEY